VRANGCHFEIGALAALIATMAVVVVAGSELHDVEAPDANEEYLFYQTLRNVADAGDGEPESTPTPD
jgi:hypothetical protein